MQHNKKDSTRETLALALALNGRKSGQVGSGPSADILKSFALHRMEMKVPQDGRAL